MAGERIIEWTDDGYPTPKSLERLREIVTGDDLDRARRAFYAALRENRYPGFCGPERVEVRGELMDVWAYHTGGWSGHEEIIGVLRESGFLWWWLLERYDRGGHYYFTPPEKAGVRDA